MSAKVRLHLLQCGFDLRQLLFRCPAQGMIRRHPRKLIQEQGALLTERRLQRQQARIRSDDLVSGRVEGSARRVASAVSQSGELRFRLNSLFMRRSQVGSQLRNLGVDLVRGVRRDYSYAKGLAYLCLLLKLVLQL